jgi:5-methylthioadenosine/S-adenosylhomocysteine deaminase
LTADAVRSQRREAAMRIRSVSIPDFRNFTIARNMTITIEGGIVSSVEPDASAEGAQAAGTTCAAGTAGGGLAGTGRGMTDAGAKTEETIDGSGMYAMPGMVNLHAHTAMTLLRGTAEDARPLDWFNKYIWVYEKNLEPADIYVGTVLGAAEMLLSGITCVADHYFSMEQAFRAYTEIGMRADLAWAVFGVGEGWEASRDRALEFTAEYRNRHPLVTISLGPHSPYLCPDDFLARMAKLGADERLRLHIHVSEDAGQVERSITERGITPLEVLDRTGVLVPGTILAHAYHATDSDLALIASRGAWSAHCPITDMRFGDAAPFLGRALAAGVGVALGTDGAASNGTMSLVQAARSAALLAKCAAGDAEAGRIADILPLLFSGGKALVHPRYGAIAPGIPADIVLYDPAAPATQPENDPFAGMLYASGNGNIDTVLVAGRVVVRKGKLTTLDPAALYREAEERAVRLRCTAGGGPMQRYGG